MLRSVEGFHRVFGLGFLILLLVCILAWIVLKAKLEGKRVCYFLFREYDRSQRMYVPTPDKLNSVASNRLYPDSPTWKFKFLITVLDFSHSSSTSKSKLGK